MVAIAREKPGWPDRSSTSCGVQPFRGFHLKDEADVILEAVVSAISSQSVQLWGNTLL